MARVTKSSAKYPNGYSEFGGKKHRLTKAGNVDLRTVSPAQRKDYKLRQATTFKDSKERLKEAMETLGDATKHDYDEIKNEYLNYDDVHQYAKELTEDLNNLESQIENSLIDEMSLDENDRDLKKIAEFEQKLEQISKATNEIKGLILIK